MSTLKERLTEIFPTVPRGLYAKIARICAVKAPSVSDWFRGESKTMARGNAEVICAHFAPTINPAWLAEGRSPKYKPAGTTLQSDNVLLAQIGTRKVPLISYVQAGMWTEATDNFQPGDADEWLLTDSDLSGCAFALVIKGDSMLPDFQQGDRVIIDPEINPRPGDFVVAKNGGNEATFKKYRLCGMNQQGQQIIELVPLNPDYPPYRSDVSPITIIGTMVEHRKYRKTK